MSALLLSELKPTNIFHTELDTNADTKYQYIAYPRYKNNNKEGQLLIELPPIKITQRGIPKSQFFEHEDNPENCPRRYELSLPIDTEQQNCLEVEEYLNSIGHYK